MDETNASLSQEVENVPEPVVAPSEAPADEAPAHIAPKVDEGNIPHTAR